MWLQAESARYLHQDILRFIGSIAIVIAHYSEWLTWNGHRIPSNFIGGLGQAVDIFFLISGVIIFDLYKNRPNYYSFLQRRFARIAPLHYVVLLAFLLKGPLSELAGIPYDPAGLADPACIIPNITFTHAFNLCSSLSFNTPSWSISAEAGMYLLFPLALIVAKKPWGIVVPLTAIAILTAWSWHGKLWFYWNYDLGVLRALPAFFIGCWIANHRHLLHPIPQPRFLFWGLIAIYPVLAYFIPIILIAIAYAIGIVAVCADDRPSAYLTRVAGLGRLAFSIYMLHMIVGSVLIGNVAIKILHLHDAALIGFGVLTALMLIPISMFSLFYFEEPMRRLLTPKRPKHGQVAVPVVP